MDEATLSLDDMFLLLFCTLDDLYREVVPEAIQRRSQHQRIAFSDSEVLTLSIMQEALSNDSERSFHRFVRKNYHHLFPQLVSRDRYHRRRKALWAVQELLLRHLSQRLAQSARWLVVDSAPIETVKFARSQSGRRSIPEAEYGYIPSEKRVFFGLRLHLLISDGGAIVGFALTAANAPEREAAEGLLAEHAGQYVLADNGYSGARFREAASANEHQVLASPRPSQRPASKAEARARRWLRAQRELIETVVGMLADQFTLETTRARSLWGVMTRLGAKLLAFNLSIDLNQMLKRPPLAIKALYL
jgi:transposase